MIRQSFLLALVFGLAVTSAQAQFSVTKVGAEFQVYPAGYVPGIYAEGGWSNKWAYGVRLGYNSTDRKDFSIYHDTERGGGFGGSLGAKYYFNSNTQGLFTELRTDLWFMTIEWENIDRFAPPVQISSTDIVVFQPAIIVGYTYTFSDRLNASLTLANGREFNVVTRGEKVMQGFITLGGLQLSYVL